MTEPQELIKILNTELAIDLPEKTSIDDLEKRIAEHINHLIQHNFQQLVVILYRVDVSEEKLKTLLHENTDTDAASIIAGLIIERELQKIKSRREYKKGENNQNISEEEKW